MPRLQEHANSVFQIYDQALRDWEWNKPNAPHLAELHALHNSLVRFGYDGT